MNKLWCRIRRSHFIQSVAVLGSGTLLAQIIMIAASPVLTRLYNPADFGLAALFAAVVASISPAICGKYEVAIVVAKSDEHGKQLLGLAFAVAAALSLAVFIGVWFFGEGLLALLNAERLIGWVMLVPLALLFNGLLAGLNYYSNRELRYGVISQSKVFVALLGVATSITLGIFGLHYGLVISATIASGSVSLWLLFHYRAILSKSVLTWNSRKCLVMRRYREFPLYNASFGLLDGVTLALPIFFLTRYFPEAVVGYYALMIRVAIAPVGFIADAVSQVNLKKVSYLVHQKDLIRPYLLRATLLLLLIVSPLLIVLMPFAPSFFAFVFGEQWSIAGDYLQILMPALALRFIVSTLSSTFGATGHNKLGAIWKVTAFITTFSVYLIVAPRVDVAGMLVAILLTDLVLYSFYYALAWYAAGHPKGYR